MALPVELSEPRYEFVRELGRGAMGSVCLVNDSVRGHAVAQKHLSNGAAAASLHFKREFRVLSRLLHPNLVRVYELGQDAQGLFFIMEAIDGVPLDQYCAERDVLQALQHVLPQIIDALVFIHAHGVVHRDLKPNNVLVTRDGVVKLLDFGVLGHFNADGGEGERFVIAGTPGYMAPEQIQGKAPQPASDLYALGCMLFELLAKTPVFDGVRASMLHAHLSEPAPRLAAIAPSAPPLFDVICHELLDKDPERRPTAEELGRRLLEPLGAQLSLPPRPPHVLGELIGRDALIEALLAELRSPRAPSILALVGPSGVGKSTLVERVARELEREGRLVLRGRARPSERVAYNALDGAVDDLARMLARRDAGDAGVQDAAEIARRVFPVLAASGFATAERCKELVRFRLFGRGPALSRAVVFEALHRLMLRAAEPDGRIVIVIDDLQWADEDSLALLSHVEDAKRGAPLVIVSLRDDVGATAGDRWLGDRAGARRVVVPALGEGALREIVTRVAQAAGVEPSPGELVDAVRRCDGRPFLAELAGRALATTGQPDLSRIVEECSELERDLLGLLVASDDWTSGPLLATLTRQPLGLLDDAISALAHGGLVRRGGRGGIEGVVDLYHDVVRRAAAEVLPEHVQRGHAALADHWANVSGAPPERRVRHLLGAGRREQAAEQAIHAARHAEEQRAFGLAADMYEVALSVERPSPEPLIEARAQALEKVGRYLDAASAWDQLRAQSGRERRLDFALREASALIAANQVDRGLDGLDRALAESGDPPSHSRSPLAVLSAASFALGPEGRHLRRAVRSLARRTSVKRDHQQLASAELDVRIGILLSFLDPMSGVRYLLRARDRFARAGARVHEALSNYTFAVLAMIGSRKPRVPLAERYIRHAESLLGAGPRPIEARAMADFVVGLEALRSGDWNRGRDALDAAARAFETTGAVTERLMSVSWSATTHSFGQNVPALRSSISWFRQNLDELGGGIISAHVELMEGYLRYLEGNFEGCRESIDRLIAMYAGRRPNVQRGGALLYRHMADVYSDQSSEARREFLATMRAVSQFRFFETSYSGPYAMIGGFLEAAALQRGERGASMERLSWFARHVDEAPPFVAGASYRARAYALSRAEPARAIELLARAEHEALRFDRRVDAAIARFQRGLRLRGARGSELCESARAAIVEAGASERLLHEDSALR